MTRDPRKMTRWMIPTVGGLGCFRAPCLLCRGPASAGLPVCSGCRRELPWRGWARAPASHGLVCDGRWPVFAAFAYRYPVDRIIARTKGGAEAGLALWLLGAALEGLPADARASMAGLQACVVPSQLARLRERQADLPARLADGLTAHGGMARSPPAHWLPGTHVAQHGRNSGQRRARATARFHFKQRLDGLPLLLVDDVCTTGATLASLGSAAEAAGGRVAGAMVLALADPPGQAPDQTSRFTTERA